MNDPDPTPASGEPADERQGAHRAELLRSLDALHAELDRVSEGEELDEARLGGLVADVEERLSGADESHHPTNLVDRLRQRAEQFELEHPAVTSLLNRIMVSLGNTGI